MFKSYRLSYLIRIVIALAAGLTGCGKKQSEEIPEAPNVSYTKPLIEVTDARGRTVSLKNPAIRIISLLPSLTEYIFELDKGHLLVGRTNWCKYPKEAQAVEIVGGLENPIVENLRRLKPDLVLAGPFLNDERVNHLESLGLTVATFDHQNWETIVKDLTILGTLLDNPGDVKTLISWLSKQRKNISEEIQDLNRSTPVKTAILYALNPLYTSGAGTFVDEMIEYAGGTNVAADLSSNWPIISMKDLLQKQPEVIIVSTEAGTSETLGKRIRALGENDAWSQLIAFQNNRVYLLDGDLLAIPGTRQMKAQLQIAAAIHPTIFEASEELIHLNLLKSPMRP